MEKDEGFLHDDEDTNPSPWAPGSTAADDFGGTAGVSCEPQPGTSGEPGPRVSSEPEPGGSGGMAGRRQTMAAQAAVIEERPAKRPCLRPEYVPTLKGKGVVTDTDSVAALTLSLSTLTAEKSRMEEAFQADKRVTREKYENMLASMKEETKSLVQQHLVEINNLKAKIAYEIQEREKERADHSAMLKELHLKLNSERKIKEKLEDQAVHSNETQASQAELEKRVRDLSGSLEAARRKLQRAEARTAETPALLVRLQHRLALQEQAHAVAIREEQIKAKRSEEAARKAAARHEERVALLEARLAELSAAVGEADRRRRRDQATIQQLRESLGGRLAAKVAGGDELAEDTETPTQSKSETDNEKLADSEYLQTLIDKIHILKKELIAENDKLGSPLDITTLFKMEGYVDVHMRCKEDLDTVRAELEAYKALNNDSNKQEDAVERLNNEIEVLNEKLETYKIMLEEEKTDKADRLKLYEEKLCAERERHAQSSGELRARLAELERQARAQRERCAALLADADGRLRARSDHGERRTSAGDGPALTDVSAPPHMLHYAQELARKDLDITQLRKEKYILEGQFRDCQREATIEKDRFKEVIRTLKEEIDRLRRSQSREGANLEYLKNVVIAFVTCTECSGRRHMLNAIAAVLRLTPAERRAVLAAL